jgi:predicted phosphodiesterase
VTSEDVMPAPPIDPSKRRLAEQLLREGKLSSRSIAERCGISTGMVSKVRTEMSARVKLHEPGEWPEAEPELPEPLPEGGGAALPDSLAAPTVPFALDGVKRCLVIGDVHLPYHAPEAVRAAVDDGKRQGVDCVLLNGDTLDFYQLSRFSRDPNKARVKLEIEQGREFLRWVRAQFPKARLVFKEGNHDERLRTFLFDRAPEVFDLDSLHLPNLLNADNVGCEWVGDKRVVMVGGLPVIHGHEYRGGGGVQPSRWLYLRTGDSALTNHFHRTDHYTFRTVTDREVGMWSVGCLCYLKPSYAPLNQWTHGWAVVDVDGGKYTVQNRQRLRCGRVV